jgi:superfamily II DNA or RNA helicase
VNLNISIGEFIESVEEFKDIQLLDNQEINISDLQCYVPTPSGKSQIAYIIKKENLSGLSLILENNIEIKCATKHILQQFGLNVYADCLQIGDIVDTKSGPVKIVNITQLSDTTFYDIGIEAPHIYYDSDGVVHHNTITTATLSQLSEKYGRSIIIVPNKSLVEQTEEDFINVGLDVGVYYGDRKNLNKTHTICTWQSLNIFDKKSKNSEHDVITLAEFLDNVKTVIVDEVHMAKAAILQNLLTQNLCNAPIRWGLTGTIPKDAFEAEPIYASIGSVVGGIKAHELQERGVLSNCHVNIVQLIDLPEFKSYQDELKYLVTDENRMIYISKLINDISQSGNTLVLVNRIDSGKFLVDALGDAVFISGEVKTKDRKSEYDEVKTSSNKIIVATYGVAAVGINIPRIFNLVLLEAGKSFVRVIQSIGRGIRKAEDKDFVQIWDLTSTCKYAKKHLTERKRFYKDAHYQFTLEKTDWTKNT